MKKNTTLLFALILGIIATNAQTYQWAKRMGGASYDIGYSIAVDSSGNVYTTGSFQGIVDFDPGPGISYLFSAGSDSKEDIFISKLDAAGNFVWAKRMGGNYADISYSIAVDGSGNVYTTGFFRGTVDFDPGPGISNLVSVGGAIFISKLDAAGNFVWAKGLIGASSGGGGEGRSIALDGSGNVYITGSFVYTIDFDPGPGIFNLSSTGNIDIFVTKLDSAGNFIWAKNMGSGLSSDEGRSIAVDDTGNVYTTGFFQYTADFDPGPGISNLTSAGQSDIFISKLNATGNFVWAKSFGNLSSDQGASIALDDSGNVYTTGNFYGYVAFILKLDAAANLVWAKSMSGVVVGGSEGRSITLDGSGNVYTTGKFNGTVDFNPGTDSCNLTSVGANDVFISKLDAAGNFEWARSMGWAYGNSITVDGSGDVFTTGHFFGTVDFNPGAGTSNLTSMGQSDIFILTSNPCGVVTGTDIVTACNSYTWIDGNTYTASNSIATHNIVGGAANGCDTLVTLDLTIDSVSDITTSISGVTLSANNTGASYQWLDCDNNYSLIASETGQSFTATANGNYAVELTENGCVDTSTCVAITTVGMLENTSGSVLTVYPNPTKGEFSIELGKSYEGVTILIRNILGQEVLTESYTNTSVLQLTIVGEAGMYFIEVSFGDKKAIVKVVKE